MDTAARDSSRMPMWLQRLRLPAVLVAMGLIIYGACVTEQAVTQSEEYIRGTPDSTGSKTVSADSSLLADIRD